MVQFYRAQGSFELDKGIGFESQNNNKKYSYSGNAGGIDTDRGFGGR